MLQVQGAVNLNAFGFELRNEPTTVHRQSMASSLFPGVDPVTFLRGHAERVERLYSSDDPVGRYYPPPSLHPPPLSLHTPRLPLPNKTTQQ